MSSEEEGGGRRNKIQSIRYFKVDAVQGGSLRKIKEEKGAKRICILILFQNMVRVCYGNDQGSVYIVAKAEKKAAWDEVTFAPSRK